MTTAVEINKQSPIGLNAMGAGNITDFIVTNMLMSKLTDVLKEDFKFNTINLAKLALLMSSGEIKNVINSIFEYIITLLKLFPAQGWSIIKYIYARIRNQYVKKDIKVITETIKISEKIIEIKVNDGFIAALYEYINNNQLCTYQMYDAEIEIKNKKEQFYNSIYTNIAINYKDIKYTIISNVNIKKNIITNEAVCNIIGEQKINSICDLMNEVWSTTIQKLYDNYIKYFKSPAELITKFKYEKELNHEVKVEYYITDELVKLYKINYEETLIKLVILTALMHKYSSDSSMMKLLRVNKRDFIFSMGNIQLNEQLFTGTTLFTKNYNGLHIKDLLRNSESGTGYKPIEFSSDLLDCNDEMPWHKTNVKNTTENKTKTIKIKMYPDTPIATTNLRLLISEIYESYKKIGTKVKLSCLKLTKNIKTTTNVNPLYEEYKTKKQELEKLDQKDVLAKFLLEPTPQKTIEDKTTSKTVSSVLLNEFEKNIDTLYLRKNDKNKLLNSLSQFRDKKHILQDLGLQNKLNILLYGEPGTGKSTAIQSIATYLQKDIFYLDFQQAECNQDLGMLFEHVNKNVATGGIIVIEDIDAMTDIVLERKNTQPDKKQTITSLADNETKLTLEYLLNVLQGTLTIDDSIFIVTTNHIDHLDKAFTRDGRFDVKIEMKLCDWYQIACIYKKIMGNDIPDEVLHKIPENTFSPARIIFHIKNYMFSQDTAEIIMQEFMTN